LINRHAEHCSNTMSSNAVASTITVSRGYRKADET
jgi:hypothetical protein